MTNPIAVGDLVVVVRYGESCGCNRGSDSIGRIFMVHSISMSNGRYCVGCDAPKPDVIVARPKNDPNSLIYTLPRLKRIPPLAELEGQRTQEDIREPA